VPELLANQANAYRLGLLAPAEGTHSWAIRRAVVEGVANDRNRESRGRQKRSDHYKRLDHVTNITPRRAHFGRGAAHGLQALVMTLDDLSRLAAQLDGVAERSRDDLLDWRYRGRLVVRQLDDSHVVVRASFDFRDFLLQSFPETFSVPKRFAKHMMVVADLENGNPDVIEDAVIAAWELQSGK
jgi:hypothetical protein